MTISESTITSMKHPAAEIITVNIVIRATDSTRKLARRIDAKIWTAPQTINHDFFLVPKSGTESESIPKMNLVDQGSFWKVMKS